MLRLAVAFFLFTCVALGAPEGKRDRGKGGATQNSTCNDVPAHLFDLILGRPTRDAVTLSVLTYQDTEGCIAYGTQRGSYTRQTPTRQFKKDEPVELVIGSLQPNTPYYYQFRDRGTNSAEAAFHTQRPRGSAFTFTIIADSHGNARSAPNNIGGSKAPSKRATPNSNSSSSIISSAAQRPKAAADQKRRPFSSGAAGIPTAPTASSKTVPAGRCRFTSCSSATTSTSSSTATTISTPGKRSTASSIRKSRSREPKPAGASPVTPPNTAIVPASSSAVPVTSASRFPPVKRRWSTSAPTVP